MYLNWSFSDKNVDFTQFILFPEILLKQQNNDKIAGRDSWIKKDVARLHEFLHQHLKETKVYWYIEMGLYLF